MSSLSYDEKMAEWNRLANTGWLFMSADDIKSSQEAIRELLTRDAQWADKWKAALDLLDSPLARIASLEARLEMATSDSETYDYRRGFAAGAAAMQARAAGVCAERAVVEREKASKEMDADACGRALSREASARYLAAAIAALTLEPGAGDGER